MRLRIGRLVHGAFEIWNFNCAFAPVSWNRSAKFVEGGGETSGGVHDNFAAEMCDVMFQSGAKEGRRIGNAEKGANDLCALLDRSGFKERESELIAHACGD